MGDEEKPTSNEEAQKRDFVTSEWNLGFRGSGGMEIVVKVEKVVREREEERA